MRFEKAASLMASLCRLRVEVEIWSTIEQQSWHGKIRHGLGEDRFFTQRIEGPEHTTSTLSLCELIQIIFHDSSCFFLGTHLSGSLLMFLVAMLAHVAVNSHTVPHYSWIYKVEQ